MTFEMTSLSFFDEVSATKPHPFGQCPSIVHVEPLKIKTNSQSEPHKEICYESIERQRWEDEGGNCFNSPDLNDRPHALGSGAVESHLN